MLSRRGGRAARAAGIGHGEGMPLGSLALPLTALATAALLVAGIVGVAVHDPPAADPGAVTAGAGPSAPGAGSIGPVPDVGDVLPELQAFVSRQRGLPFLREVDIQLLGGSDFEARLGTLEGTERREVDDVGAILLAMGLLPRGTDLAAEVDRFAGQAVLGFYDAETDELVVRGEKATVLVRTTLVHELVHALEDQHFDLDRPDLGDEAATGLQALVEGSAVRIEERYIESLSPAERRAGRRAERAQSRGIAPDLPEVVQFAFGFPYAFGPGLVQALLDAGGQARLDRAFARPPESSEQVLDPSRYLRGDRPVVVAVPPADRPPFDEGEIGELFLALMLQAELGDGQARTAAQGWGGDRYVAWRDGGRTCVRMRFVMDTAADEAELVQALAEWAAQRPAAASASGTSLRTCA